MFEHSLAATALRSPVKLVAILSFALILPACKATDEPGTSSSTSSTSTSSTSTSSSSTSSTTSSSGSSSSTSSSSGTPNNTVLSADNHYLSPKASVAPVIDGNIDDSWNAANWMAMTVAWTGFENLTAPSSSADFSGKYKAMWTEDHLYLLLDITDDIINTSGQYWEQDTVEIFLDEDQSGGQHNQSHNAFAYHINHNLDVVDNGGDPAMISSHISSAINTQGTRHIWEIQIEIYSEHNGYVLSEQEAARVTLTAGKIMGFTPSYIDNDGHGTREHFMSSVNSSGHQSNQGYLNADSFGSIELIE